MILLLILRPYGVFGANPKMLFLSKKLASSLRLPIGFTDLVPDG